MPKYHHGDLRAALLEAGLELTRAAGPQALGIREVTRQVGVSPTAAYRHFADRQALLAAVGAQIQDRMAAAMRVSGAGRGGGTRASRARAQLRAVGMGYIEFALTEPGWFAVAFFGSGGGARVAPPYQLLVDALDAMREAGVLTAQQRDGAEWPCWAAVHGYAELALHGPLAGLPRGDLLARAERTVHAIIAGVEAGS